MTDKYYEIAKKFGKKIKVMRVMKDISQEKLAELADIHRTTVGSIENATISPSLTTIAKLADAFDMTLPEIVDLNHKY